MMIIHDLLDRMNRERRKRERGQSAKTYAAVIGVALAIGAGVMTGILFNSKSGKETRRRMMNKVFYTAEDIKGKAIQKVETVKDAVAHAESEASEFIKDIHEKTEDIKGDIQDGQQNIKQDVKKTVGNISEHLKED